MLIEGPKQSDGMFDVVDTSRLSDAMHTELRIAQIQRSNSQGGRQHRTDGAAAARIVPHHEELKGDTSGRGWFVGVSTADGSPGDVPE